MSFEWSHLWTRRLSNINVKMCPIWSLLVGKQQLQGGSKVNFKIYDLLQHRKCAYRCIMCVNEWIWLTSHTLSHTLSVSERLRGVTTTWTPLTSLILSLVRFLTTASASMWVCARGAFKVVIHEFFLSLFKALRANYWGVSAPHFPNLSLTKCAQFLLKGSTFCLWHSLCLCSHAACQRSC